MDALKVIYGITKWVSVLALGVAMGAVLNDLGLKFVLGAWVASLLILFVGLLFHYQDGL